MAKVIHVVIIMIAATGGPESSVTFPGQDPEPSPR